MPTDAISVQQLLELVFWNVAVPIRFTVVKRNVQVTAIMRDAGDVTAV